MEKLQIRVRITDRLIETRGSRMNLDESFFYAGVSRILNRDDEIALELKYQNREEDFLFEESERIYKFFEQESLTDRIEVNPCGGFGLPGYCHYWRLYCYCVSLDLLICV